MIGRILRILAGIFLVAVGLMSAPAVVRETEGVSEAVGFLVVPMAFVIVGARLVCRVLGEPRGTADYREVLHPLTQDRDESPSLASEPPTGAARRKGARRKQLRVATAAAGSLMTLSTITAGLGFFVLWFAFAFALRGAAPKRWLGGLLLASVLSAVGAAISVKQGPSSAPKPTTSDSLARTPSDSEARQDHQLALLWARGSKSRFGGFRHHYVEGQVKNLSNEPLENVTAVAIWYDIVGTVINSDEASIDSNPLLPGQIASFETTSRGHPSVMQFSLKFRTSPGAALSVDDRRPK
jgi:hypothetical protein